MKIQSNEPLQSPPTSYHPIHGDPATRRFGIFFFCALSLITIIVMIGIGVGNIPHYEYFGPSNNMNISVDVLANQTIFFKNL
ncbi:unnamed protein product [Rotaria sordida]|uniref:Uncharacterized protein n=1 Tax=Rotaria sordida TaxID=392033 RepID=A0A814SBC1_9BILA|nr:unnamed protein product [Rotaria sordida]CAF1196491.1 unnamed protein product [Rotaria sordida]